MTTSKVWKTTASPSLTELRANVTATAAGLLCGLDDVTLPGHAVDLALEIYEEACRRLTEPDDA